MTTETIYDDVYDLFENDEHMKSQMKHELDLEFARYVKKYGNQLKTANDADVQYATDEILSNAMSEVFTIEDDGDMDQFIENFEELFEIVEDEFGDYVMTKIYKLQRENAS